MLAEKSCQSKWIGSCVDHRNCGFTSQDILILCPYTENLLPQSGIIPGCYTESVKYGFDHLSDPAEKRFVNLSDFIVVSAGHFFHLIKVQFLSLI